MPPNLPPNAPEIRQKLNELHALLPDETFLMLAWTPAPDSPDDPFIILDATRRAPGDNDPRDLAAAVTQTCISSLVAALVKLGNDAGFPDIPVDFELPIRPGLTWVTFDVGQHWHQLRQALTPTILAWLENYLLAVRAGL